MSTLTSRSIVYFIFLTILFSFIMALITDAFFDALLRKKAISRNYLTNCMRIGATKVNKHPSLNNNNYDAKKFE